MHNLSIEIYLLFFYPDSPFILNLNHIIDYNNDDMHDTNGIKMLYSHFVN